MRELERDQCADDVGYRQDSRDLLEAHASLDVGVGHETLNEQDVQQVPAAFPFLMATIPADALLVDLLVTPEGGLNFLLAPGAAERDPKGVPGVLRRIAFVDL